MNKLTKEECLKELRNMCKCCEYKSFTIECSCGTKEVFEQLINEHFDNPPLKFEELHEKMVVWDNKKHEFAEIGCYIEDSEEYWLYNFGTDIFGYVSKDEFEENRFYRYEVKENE